MTRKFTAQQATVMNELDRVMAKMEVKEHRIIKDGGSSMVAVVFVRRDSDGVLREYRFQCATWPDQRDNLRATQLAITGLWRIFEEYGVSTLENIMAGFRVLPGATLLLKDGLDPYEVLGLPTSATLREARERYRRLVHETHPDVGGDAEGFDRIKKAYDLIEEAKGAQGSG